MEPISFIINPFIIIRTRKIQEKTEHINVIYTSIKPHLPLYILATLIVRGGRRGVVMARKCCVHPSTI
jgi:hypothetical protein